MAKASKSDIKQNIIDAFRVEDPVDDLEFLVGRIEQIRQCIDILRDKSVKVLVIYGPPIIGKTSLAKGLLKILGAKSTVSFNNQLAKVGLGTAGYTFDTLSYATEYVSYGGNLSKDQNDRIKKLSERTKQKLLLIDDAQNVSSLDAFINDAFIKSKADKIIVLSTKAEDLSKFNSRSLKLDTIEKDNLISIIDLAERKLGGGDGQKISFTSDVKRVIVNASYGYPIFVKLLGRKIAVSVLERGIYLDAIDTRACETILEEITRSGLVILGSTKPTLLVELEKFYNDISGDYASKKFLEIIASYPPKEQEPLFTKYISREKNLDELFGNLEQNFGITRISEAEYQIESEFIKTYLIIRTVGLITLVGKASIFSYADKILAYDLERYNALKQCTTHGTVLGQFVEMRLRSWLREHFGNRLYKGHLLVVGTGIINDAVDNPVDKGQCDVLIYEALPDTIKFIQEDLVVVNSGAVRAIIEVKSTIADVGALEDALLQLEYLRNIAPDAKVYLFIRNLSIPSWKSQEATTLDQYLGKWGDIKPEGHRFNHFYLKVLEQKAKTLEIEIDLKDRDQKIIKLKELIKNELGDYEMSQVAPESDPQFRLGPEYPDLIICMEPSIWIPLKRPPKYTAKDHVPYNELRANGKLDKTLGSHGSSLSQIELQLSRPFLPGGYDAVSSFLYRIITDMENIVGSD